MPVTSQRVQTSMIKHRQGKMLARLIIMVIILCVPLPSMETYSRCEHCSRSRAALASAMADTLVATPRGDEWHTKEEVRS